MSLMKEKRKRYTKAEIEAEALKLDVDLNLPHAREYVLIKLRSKESKEYEEREPSDASGYTGDFNVFIIREGARLK